jgi:hypothetical protein
MNRRQLIQAMAITPVLTAFPSIGKVKVSESHDIKVGSISVTLESGDLLGSWALRDTNPDRRHRGTILATKFRKLITQIVQLNPWYRISLDRPIEFEFFNQEGGPWVAPSDAPPMTIASSDSLVRGQWEVIIKAVKEHLQYAQNRRRARARAPWGPQWVQRHLEALHRIGITFYFVRT